jgi:predicted transcriptional regulator
MPQLEFPIRRFVPTKTGDGRPLGDLESAVMQVIWGRRAEVQVVDVQAALPREPAANYNTVKTTMERLERKGILTRVKRGKAYVYSACVTQAELERRIVSHALDRLVEQFPSAVASFFVSPNPEISPAKLALLKDALERSQETQDE